MKTSLEAALEYARCGFYPVPIPWKEKGPVASGWQNLRLTTPEAVTAYFNGERQNVGIIMGEPDGLADVDLDSREALWAWQHFAPPTGWVHGRRSKPASHFFYYPDPTVRSLKIVDPTGGKGKQACLLELRALSSTGERGLQTLVPPSIHPSGETIEFAPGATGIPARTDGGELVRAVRRTGACSLLGRYAPYPGTRHDYFLAIAGGLARAQWALQDAVKLLSAVYQILWGADADLEAARKEADTTFQRHDDGQETTGLARLAQMLESRVFRRVIQLLEIERAAEPAASTQPKPIPPVYTLDELATLKIAHPEALIDGILITPGLTLLVAPPKAGKTILGVQIALSLASGLNLFDQYSTLGQTNVLVIEQDDPQGLAAMQSFRQKSRAARAGAPLHCIAGSTFVLGEAHFLDWLRQFVREHRIGLVYLDSYTALRGLRGPNQSDIVKLESAELLVLSETGRDLGCAILMSHHDSKSSAHLDWSSRAAGSFAVGAASDTLIFLERFPELEDDQTRLVRIRSRHLASKELVIRLRAETLDFDFVMEGAASRDYPEIRHLWHQFPSAQAFSARQITDELGWPRTTAYRLLRRLTWCGILIKTGSAWMWGAHAPFRLHDTASGNPGQ
jgi:hypothetical protein